MIFHLAEIGPEFQVGTHPHPPLQRTELRAAADPHMIRLRMTRSGQGLSERRLVYCSSIYRDRIPANFTSGARCDEHAPWVLHRSQVVSAPMGSARDFKMVGSVNEEDNDSQS